MSRLTLCVPFFAAAVAGAAVAQDTRSFTWCELPSAQAVAVGLTWPHGLQQDAVHGERGAALVVAECRLLHARATVKDLIASTLHVDRDVTCIVGVVPAGERAGETAAAFVRALLHDGSTLSDDDIARIVARQALAADDAEVYLPGDVMLRRALGDEAMFDRAIAVSTEIAKLLPATVRERLRAPMVVTGAGTGALTPALRAAVEAVPLPNDATVSGTCTLPSTPTNARGEMQSELHPRIDQPFVMAAFKAPLPPACAPFAVGVEVARARAAKQMKLYGSEIRARAPLVVWSWLAADQALRFHRTGPKPRRLLPGERPENDVKKEVAATWRDLRAFLDDLRRRPPAAAEVEQAKASLLAEFGLDVAAGRPVVASVLPNFLLVQMLASRRGIDAAAIRAVEPAAAHAALTAAIESGRGYYLELLPKPDPGVTWSRR